MSGPSKLGLPSSLRERRAARDRLAELIRSARSVVALTGAGISVPSGIPDFRSPGTGLWENVDPMEVAHISVWRRTPERFWWFYGQRFATLEGKQPNGAHRALAALEAAGRLDAVITQNIDGLHAAAGSHEVIEVHGSIATASCLACRARFPLGETRARLEADAAGVPRCDCGDPLKPDVVLFGELLDEAAMDRATELAAGASLLLCIGSSLEVHPVAGLPELTLDAGGRLAVVTQKRHALRPVGGGAARRGRGGGARRGRRRTRTAALKGRRARPSVTFVPSREQRCHSTRAGLDPASLQARSPCLRHLPRPQRGLQPPQRCLHRGTTSTSSPP